MENHTAKHFVLQLGSLISLYLSLSFLLVLIFGIISLIVPDATDSVWQIESAGSSVRLGIAMVMVFFPAYLVLTRLVNKDRRKNPQGSYLGLTKWLIYLSLLLGGAVLLGDLVAVIMGFLEGDLTQRFLLKAVAVVIVIGAAFTYYLRDVKGFWLKNEKQSIFFGVVAVVVVLITLLCGFMHIDPPASVREQKLDATQVQDLQQIQWQIEDYLRLNKELPVTLESLVAMKGVPIPTSPENRPDYQYATTEAGFQLCATFIDGSEEEIFGHSRLPFDLESAEFVIINSDNWNHIAGEFCFQREVRFSENN